MTPNSTSSVNGSLLARAQKGDILAFEKMLHNTAPQVRAALPPVPAWATSSLSLDDVMQVTYLEAFLRRDTTFSPDSLIAWLRRIAMNNFKDALRALTRDKRDARRCAPSEGSSTGVSAAITHATPSRSAARREHSTLVKAAMARLPADYRNVIVMMDLQQRTAVETAAAMKRSIGAVYMLRERARARLREHLGPEHQFFTRTDESRVTP